MGEPADVPMMPWRQQLLAALTAAVVCVVLFAPVALQVIPQYRLWGDDFALARSSSPAYVGPGDWTKWFTEGYSGYFDNYPDWPAIGSAFMRPVANAAFYMAGTASGVVGEGAYLSVNYVALLLTVFGSGLLLASVRGIRWWQAAGPAVAVGLSPAHQLVMFEAAFLTNALALMFCVASLAVLGLGRHVTPTKLMLAATLQILAVASHEIAVVMPVVSALMIRATSPVRVRLRAFWPLSLPVIAFLAGRLVLQVPDGVYALRGVGAGTWIKRVLAYLFGPLVPLDIHRAMEIATHGGDARVIGAYVLTWATGLLAAGVLGAGLLRPGTRRISALFIAAIFTARIPGLLGGMQVRFGALSLVVIIVAVLWLAPTNRRWVTQVFVAGLLVSQALMFSSKVVDRMDIRLQEIAAAGAFVDATRAAVRETLPSMLVLVNDRVAAHGSSALLEVVAWPRGDVRLVVLSGYAGEHASEGAQSALTSAEGMLTFTQRLGQGQRLAFWGNIPQPGVPNQGFIYQMEPTQGSEQGGRYLRAAGPIVEGRTLVVGFDPSTGLMREPTLY